MLMSSKPLRATPKAGQFDVIPHRKGYSGPTFTLKNRVKRVAWKLAWLFAARWTPPPLHRWRVLVLRLFGARVSWCAAVYPNVDIWAPWNLTIEDYGSLGPGVRCYNIAPVKLGEHANVSQGSYLCTGTHDFRTPEFPLTAQPITIGRRAWICADAFVGPGVVAEDGAILAARGVAFDHLQAWTIYKGNPAVAVRQRPVIDA